MSKNQYLKKRLPPNASQKHRELANLLEQLFPYYTIIYEYSCESAANKKGVDPKPYGVENQAFDFFIVELDMAIEMQGEQHYKDNHFFGNTAKERDRRKRIFCQDLGIEMIEVPFYLDINQESILSLMEKNQDE